MLNENKILINLKQSIYKVDSEATILLFGSRAKGNFNDDSDWDILILTKKIELVNSIKNEILNFEIDNEICVHALVFEVSDWENKAIMPLYKSIKTEGIKL